ncbi:hypothetical protein, partial [Thermofilum sp.]|uniref:hypothetical protein n=1 Tax=Thermofilum sp. TaxID=1961369 RepID=UPI00316926A6
DPGNTAWLLNQAYYMGVDMRVYPQYRVVSYEPVVIEANGYYFKLNNDKLSRIMLIIAHMPGADVEKIAWAYVVSSGEEDVDNSLEEAYMLLEDLEKKGLILVV